MIENPNAFVCRQTHKDLDITYGRGIVLFVSILQFNLHHLISFLFVAKTKSFSRASEQLGITQPAVTQHIHALEVQFGVKLINLSKKRVFLTKAGERLVPYAEDLYNQALMAHSFLKSYRLNNLSIGIASQLLLYFMALIDKFKEKQPSTRISVREGPSLMLSQELLDFKHDICLIGPSFDYNERLQVYRIPRDEQMFFVVSPEYPIVRGNPMTWEHLAPYPLILQSEGSAARELVLYHFRKRGLTPTIGAEVDNIEFAKELARQKKGVGFMFEPNIREEITRGSLKVIEMEDGPIRIGAIDVVMNREVISPTARAFLTTLKEHFEGIREISPHR
jgi:LysR family transcriptional regulator, transcriptional activator of the cysJI operon